MVVHGINMMSSTNRFMTEEFISFAFSWEIQMTERKVMRELQQIVPTPWGDYIVALYRTERPNRAHIYDTSQYMKYSVGYFAPNTYTFYSLYEGTDTLKSHADARRLYEILVTYLPIYGDNFAQYYALAGLGQ